MKTSMHQEVSSKQRNITLEQGESIHSPYYTLLSYLTIIPFSVLFSLPLPKTERCGLFISARRRGPRGNQTKDFFTPHRVLKNLSDGGFALLFSSCARSFGVFGQCPKRLIFDFCSFCHLSSLPFICFHFLVCSLVSCNPLL